MHYTEAVNRLIREQTKVGVADGVLVINRECEWSDGARLGGEFVCDVSAAGWLASQLERAANEETAEVEYNASPDHLLVFASGGERGEPISIHVLNRREASATHGKTSGLSAMSPTSARQLAVEIRTTLGVADEWEKGVYGEALEHAQRMKNVKPSSLVESPLPKKRKT